MARRHHEQLLEAGVHFGHQTRRWNPKMKRFIFGERNGIYIIDLAADARPHRDRLHLRPRPRRRRRHRSCSSAPRSRRRTRSSSYAEKCGMPYINERWLGGMLTNFETIVQARRQDEGVPAHARLRRVRGHAQEGSPPHQPRAREARAQPRRHPQHGAPARRRVRARHQEGSTSRVTEANKLGIPIVAVVDTNCDPDIIQYVIPGNDDAIRSGTLMCRVIADAVEEGRFIASRRGNGAGRRPAAERTRRGGGRRRRRSRPRPAARPPQAAAGARGPHRRRAQAGQPAAETRVAEAPGRRRPVRGRGRTAPRTPQTDASTTPAAEAPAEADRRRPTPAEEA